jgi:hypothetical protein
VSIILHDPPDHPYFSGSYWANFQNHLENQIPFDQQLNNGKAIKSCVENFFGDLLKSLLASTTNIALAVNQITAGIQNVYQDYFVSVVFEFVLCNKQ